MYSDPKAFEMYAKKIKKPVELVEGIGREVPAEGRLQTDHMADLDGAVRDAVRLGFLKKPLTKAQLAELIQIPPAMK